MCNGLPRVALQDSCLVCIDVSPTTAMTKLCRWVSPAALQKSGMPEPFGQIALARHSTANKPFRQQLLDGNCDKRLKQGPALLNGEVSGKTGRVRRAGKEGSRDV
ncbi:hypothetical protein ABBQ32_008767 [Trebouxia sp. C0010 RCD-2024]